MQSGNPTGPEIDIEIQSMTTLPLQTPSVYQPFGARLKDLRRSKGLTLEKVARAVKTHKGYVSGIENGKVRPPSPKFVTRFARFYKVDERELLRLAYAEKAPKLIRDEIIRALWPPSPPEGATTSQ